ncbi:MAG: hypothetical protein AABY14_02065, partial [Nanoarchaeota archaeon]
QYTPGIGLIDFIFPQRIPTHIHPFSDRMIIPISGKGYTLLSDKLDETIEEKLKSGTITRNDIDKINQYIVKHEMSEDTFSAFVKRIVHTNGPNPGEIYRLWAVQLPWIKSGIDHNEIAGDENFVKYVESEPPPELWNTKEELELVIEKLSK